MNRKVAIQVAGVSKRYFIYGSPKDRLRQIIADRMSWFVGGGDSKKEQMNYRKEFVALEDISFEVMKGESVGIIGRNGAGKSTLLQIITGTLFPTKGTVLVDGSVGALLELGSGFNPEFTGKENVYLNASLLGLSKREIDERYREIVDFADIGEFIDQPVKTYSSGMMLRLAFSVQTIIEPAILIVDEALAVGDMFFQAKCMARLKKLIDKGVTVLFVSHDIGTVRQLCSKALLLKDGRVEDFGDVKRVTDRYQKLDIEDRNRNSAPSDREDAEARDSGSRRVVDDGFVLSNEELSMDEALQGNEMFLESSKNDRSGNGQARFLNVQMMKGGKVLRVFDYGDIVTLRQTVRFEMSMEKVNVVYKIRTLQGTDVVYADTRLTSGMDGIYDEGGVYVFEWRFRLDLMHGNYVILSGLTREPVEEEGDWVFFDIVPTSYMFSMAPRRGGMIGGYVVLENDLTVSRIS